MKTVGEWLEDYRQSFDPDMATHALLLSYLPWHEQVETYREAVALVNARIDAIIGWLNNMRPLADR